MFSYRRTEAVRLAAVVAVATALLSASVFAATPIVSSTSRGSSAGLDVVHATVGPASISLDTSSNAIATDGTFRFGASVESTQPLQYLQARMRLFQPSGRLIYQKTFVEPLSKSGSAAFTFERSIADIGLDQGLYPAELSVRISASGLVTETVVPTSLIVFDPEREPLPVVLVARISAQPLSDAEGKFVSDPAQFTRARDDAEKIAQWVIGDSSAHVALSLSPMMLEEWKHISTGYEFAGAEGENEVGAGDSVPRAYASALAAVSRAQATGRLEVLSLGYSDPDLSELGHAGLLGEVPAQYREGLTRTSDALDASPTAGTAPAGGAFSADAAAMLAKSGIRYAVVDDAALQYKGEAVEPGTYRLSKDGLTVLASDRIAARSFASSSTGEFRRLAFGRHSSEHAHPTLPLLVEIGPGAMNAEEFVQAARAVGQQRWMSLQLPSDVVSAAVPSKARPRAHKPDKDAPDDYWATVKNSRAWARALAWSLPASDEASQADRSSLVAESSAWSGFNGNWTLAGRGLTYAASARRSADRLFDDITLTASRVTLAGSSGRVPVTIVNRTEEPVRVTLSARPGPSLDLQQKPRQVIDLQPGENFVEIPVSLDNALQSSLRLGLQSAGVEFASDSVTLHASYLDRLALVGGLALLLGGLLAYIIVRVRKAEASASEE